MTKIHYLILAGAFVVITALSFLPKTVVKNLDKELTEKPTATNTAENTPTTETKTANNATNDVTAMHKAELSVEQQNKLATYAQKISEKTAEKEKSVWIDSIVVLLQSVNRYDSSAIVAENFAKQYSTTPNLMRAGDCYYSALQFSMNEEKSKEFADKARSFFKQVNDKEPDFSEAAVKLGLTYVASPTPMQGILLIREVLKKEPENIFAIMSLGKLSIQSGQYDKAIERFKQVLEIDKNNLEAKFLLGVSLGEIGKNQEAITLLEDLKKSTNDPAVLMQTENYLKQLKQK
jgi:tetratricopeptide (TPR) repeat protein